MQPTSSVGRTTKRSGRCLAGGARGVTLIEMMVVMVIISVVVAISTPSITAGIDAVRLTTATSAVASFLNSAVNRAERRQRPVALTITPSENRLQFVSTDAGSARELILPEGIILEAVLPAAPNAMEGGRILIMPGGTVPGIGIQLGNRHGGRRTVRLDPMTGFPHIEGGPPK